jgi:uncharacterized protein YcgL (UPF0745 family)
MNILYTKLSSGKMKQGHANPFAGEFGFENMPKVNWFTPQFFSNLHSGVNVLRGAARVNQKSPTAGKLWEGTPISDILVGKAHASAPAPQPAGYSGPTTNIGPNASGYGGYPMNPIPSGGGGGGGQRSGAGLNVGTIVDGQRWNGAGWDDAGGGNTLGDQRQQELDAINAEYDQEVGRLGGLETQTRSNYQGAVDTANSRLPVLENQIAGERDIRLNDLGNTEIQRRQESQGALAQVRQLLNDLQQRQQAYLSATGGFSSSTPEVLGEKFGRQAFSSLNNVQQQRDTALRDVDSERNKTQQFYSGKLIQAKQSHEDQIGQLQQQLQAQLDAINNAKGAAASAKRAASIDAWRAYSNAKINLDQQLQGYQNSLSQWLLQTQAQLDSAKGYQTGNISGINASDIFNNVQNQISSVGGNPAAAVSSLVTRQTGVKPEDIQKYLAGLNTGTVLGQ